MQVTITTAQGTADASVNITSATYVGVGIWTELATDPTKAACYPCHSNNIIEWSASGHPTLFQRGIDGIASSHYGESCIECHTLGFNEDSTAVNGGFDDVADELEWAFPETLQVGNWDDLVTDFSELARLGSIQCENCHGPASEHKSTFDPTKMDVSLESGVCGRCHDEPWRHIKNEQWKRSGHNFNPATAAHGAPTRSSCQPCHSGAGLVEALDGAITFADFAENPGNVSCAACHDPHKAAVRETDNIVLGNGVEVNFGGEGRLCMNCHKGRRNTPVYVEEYHRYYGPHHSNQTDMLAGANAVTFGMYIPSSTHRDALKDACVSCHMFATPGAGFAPTTPEGDKPGRDHVGEHTFAMHWDGGTPEDASDDVDNVAACERCHGELTSFDDIMARRDFDEDGTIESAMAEVEGLMDSVGVLLPPLGDTAVEVTSAYNKIQLKAAFNYKFVEEDGSHGMHNFQYAIGLLRVAKAALQYGVLSPGTIESITDVPNDQGRRVRVVWTRFGGDGVSDNPVQTYAIWRRVDDVNSMTAAQVQSVYESFEMSSADIAELPEGARVQVNQVLWDFAGAVPAARLDKYSAIAPTLFDSTKTDGMHWSVFMVSAHTKIPAVRAFTAPDSGYSVDNLAPAAPTSLAGQEVADGVELTWDDPVDKDFDYFALYRNTTPGFDPTTVEPIAKLTETSFTDSDVIIGTTYYYRLSAFDFSGNESDYSSEVSLLVTSVEGSPITAIPETYILEQNYPNPFNPSTTIGFGLKESGHVTLTVYNALGERIMQVIDGHMEAGYHRATVSAHNLPSGLYFYKIQVNNFTAVKKMVVMK